MEYKEMELIQTRLAQPSFFILSNIFWDKIIYG
jgi:hypothetical protein